MPLLAPPRYSLLFGSLLSPIVLFGPFPLAAFRLLGGQFVLPLRPHPPSLTRSRPLSPPSSRLSRAPSPFVALFSHPSVLLFPLFTHPLPSVFPSFSFSYVLPSFVAPSSSFSRAPPPHRSSFFLSSRILSFRHPLLPPFRLLCPSLHRPLCPPSLSRVFAPFGVLFSHPSVPFLPRAPFSLRRPRFEVCGRIARFWDFLMRQIGSLRPK